MPNFAHVDVLANLEARQDQLLRQLDELNQRIEQALVTCAAPPNDRPPASIETARDAG